MEPNKCCDTCEYCMYICEGDYICDVEVDEGATVQLIKEDHTPTDHYFWCGGEYWRKN